MRVLIFLVTMYIFYRILKSVLLAPPRRRSANQAPRRGRHASDFSDVQEAEYEDITPPPAPNPPKPGH
jgi:hypothetical protein